MANVAFVGIGGALIVTSTSVFGGRFGWKVFRRALKENSAKHKNTPLDLVKDKGAGIESGAAKGAPKLLNQFNSVESLVSNAGKLTRLKGGVKQGFVKGNADDIFSQLSRQYGAKVQTGTNGRFFQSGNVRVDLTGSSGNIPTLRINNNGQLFKIRVQ